MKILRPSSEIRAPHASCLRKIWQNFNAYSATRFRLRCLDHSTRLLHLQGHTGLLCGSCLDGHGRRGLECRSCYSRGFVLFLFFCALVWFLIIVSIGIKGNLSSTRIRKRRGPRRPPVESIDAAPQPATSSQAGHTTIELEQRPAVVQNKSVTMPVCPEVAEEAQERVSSQTPLARAPQGTEDRITTQEHAKRTIAETFKVCRKMNPVTL